MLQHETSNVLPPKQQHHQTLRDAFLHHAAIRTHKHHFSMLSSPTQETKSITSPSPLCLTHNTYTLDTCYTVIIVRWSKTWNKHPELVKHTGYTYSDEHRKSLLFLTTSKQWRKPHNMYGRQGFWSIKQCSMPRTHFTGIQNYYYLVWLLVAIHAQKWYGWMFSVGFQFGKKSDILHQHYKHLVVVHSTLPLSVIKAICVNFYHYQDFYLLY